MIQYTAIFDSGLGGLAVFHHLREAYPQQNFIFFADNAQLPLGDKSEEQICHIASQDTKFLTQQEGICQALVVACGTASSYAISTIMSATNVPVIDVVRPVVQGVFAQKSPKSVGILATQASIRAGAYEREIKKYDKNCRVFPMAAPALVPLIEAGDNEALKPVLKKYLEEFPQELDVLILGCTHYILINKITQELMPQTEVVSPVSAIIGAFSPLACVGSGAEKFFCSKKTPPWQSQSALVLGRDVVWEQINPNNIK
ncbi:MAG: glutamate racemase [Brevinema sp.]